MTVVERSIWINASCEKVWGAITEPEQIPQWWGGGDLRRISALEVGGTITFGKPEDPITARIDVVDVSRQFTIQWLPHKQNHFTSMFTSFLLEEQNGGTQVTVRQTGYEALPDDERQKDYERSSAGYLTVLAGLKSYMEGTSV